MTYAAQPIEPRISDWLAARGYPAEAALPLAGDLSARRYLRLACPTGTVVLAVYPPSVRPDCGRFLKSGALLRRAGVRVPAVLASDCRRGLMLVEDLGTETLYDLAGRGDVDPAPYFAHAVAILERVSAIARDAAAALNPPLDAGLLRAELRQTEQVFLRPRGLTGEVGLERALEAGLDRLCRRLGAAPTAPCHRDFMVRNLVPAGPAPALAVLDHQGLRLGPRFYDLASLFNDSLFLPASTERRLLREQVPQDAARGEFHRAAAQRTLKAVGSYAAAAQRGSPRHLALIPPTLRRCLAHLERCSETVSLVPRLRRAWRPALDDQFC